MYGAGANFLATSACGKEVVLHGVRTGGPGQGIAHPGGAVEGGSGAPTGGEPSVDAGRRGAPGTQSNPPTPAHHRGLFTVSGGGAILPAGEEVNLDPTSWLFFHRSWDVLLGLPEQLRQIHFQGSSQAANDFQRRIALTFLDVADHLRGNPRPLGERILGDLPPFPLLGEKLKNAEAQLASSLGIRHTPLLQGIGVDSVFPYSEIPSCLPDALAPIPT
jgi:hypothetical protein